MYNPPAYGVPPPPPPVPPRQGMAIASMVLSIVSLVTCGGFCVLPLIGLILGIVALRRAHKEPAVFGGRGMAIAGIVMSLIAPVFMTIWAAIAIPNLLKSRQAANEASAITTVRLIGTAEATYQATDPKLGFTDLRGLIDRGLIQNNLFSQTNGYRFECTTSRDVRGEPIFDTVAVPLTIGPFGTGTRSYASNETYVIYYGMGQVELKGSPSNRAPRGGIAVQ